MEIWKDIQGYEGLYQVSNYGEIRSLREWRGNRYIAKKPDEASTLKGTDNGYGYLIVSLVKNRKRKNHYIHRLVATYFVENPQAKNVVNHKDYNKANNKATNLEWVTQKENVRYSIEHMKHRKSITHTNTGEKYISFRSANKKYRVQIDKKDYGCYSTLSEAIQKRDDILKEVGEWQSQL